VALGFAIVSSVLVLHADTLSASGVFWPLYVGLSFIVLVYFFVQCFQCWRYDLADVRAFDRPRPVEPRVVAAVSANWEDFDLDQRR
jgi:hypothetical protein